MFIDYLGQAPAETADLHEIVDARTQYSLQATELLQQFASFHRPQARYGFEDRLAMTLGAFAPMAGNRKPMCFIAHTLYQVQST
jgi:hypothetical protein